MEAENSLRTSVTQASKALQAGDSKPKVRIRAIDAVASEALNLLVVEDDPLDWQLMQSHLERISPNVARHWCCTGQEALEAVKLDNFDCVLIDYHLPDTVAEDLIEPMRLAAGDLWLPVIVVSGRGTDENAAASIMNGAADYLPKSRLSTQSLVRAISNALAQSRLARALEAERRSSLELNEQLVRQNRELASFYHTVSHELKTPLTAVREFCSLLDDEVLGPINAGQQEALQTSISCCDRLVRLIGDLFDAARIETGKLELNRDWFDLVQLLREEVRIMGPRARESQIDLRAECDVDIPAIYADRVRMSQVVCNLMSNAIKFTPLNGLVRVRAHFREEDALLTFSVEDNGAGISAEQTKYVFDRLYQGDVPQSKSDHGMGIGLFLCRQIVQLHGGSVHLESAPGKGSVFSVSLPLSVSAPPNLEPSTVL